MSSYHPNFPKFLSITPNVRSFACKQDSLAYNARVPAFGVEAQRTAISKYGIAGRVWEAAYALCAYVNPAEEGPDMLEFDPRFASDPSAPLGVIELGSGTGVVAASIANVIRRTSRPGAFVIATDLPDVCPLLQHNLGSIVESSMEVDDSDAIFVRPLTWGNLNHAASIANEFGFNDPAAPRRLTHITCSDLVYFPELLGPLLRTLIHLTSPLCMPSSDLPAKIVISYKIRSLSKETPFWTAFGLWFSFQPVLACSRVQEADQSDASERWRQFGANEDTDRTCVFVAFRRPESLAWHVPETDEDLMDGVGARGTSTKKGDDTFETILFMSMGIDNTDE